MKYVFYNLLAFGLLTYTFTLANEPEDNDTDETEVFVPDWDKTIRDIERDADVNASRNWYIRK